MSAAEQALLSGDENKLYEALKAMGIQNLQAQNKGWYIKQLQAERENKEQVGISVYIKPYIYSKKMVKSLLLSPHYDLNLIPSSLGVSRRIPD